MNQLSPVEARVVADLVAGTSVVLGSGLPSSSDASRRVRADVVRRLALGLPQEDGTPSGSLGAITLAGAWIDGDLLLRDARSPGGAVAPALVLANCTIPGLIDLSDGHFRRLSLAGCRITRLTCTDSRFEGGVDLSNVSSGEQGSGTGVVVDGVVQGVAMASFRNAHIYGGLRASGARLCVTPKNDTVDYSGEGRPYALDLTEAQVFGSLALQPDFSACGGVRLAAAIIKGSIWMQGASLQAEHGYALHVGQAHVDGALDLSALFRPGVPPRMFDGRGGIYLYGAAIAGELYLAGARLQARPGEPALHAYSAAIGQHVRLDTAVDASGEHSSIPFESFGTLLFLNATLGGFSASGAVLDAADGPVLDFTNAHVRGDFILSSTRGSEVRPDANGSFHTTAVVHRMVLRGAFNGSRLRIDGGLDILGTRLDSGVFPFALHLPEAVIGASVQLSPWEGGEPTVVDEGSINFLHARVSGAVVINRVEFGCRGRRLGQVNAFVAEGITIEQSVTFSDVKAWGAIDLSAARVGKGLRITSSSFHDRAPNSGLNLHHAAIGGSVDISDLTGRGYLYLKHCSVQGDLNLGDVTLRGALWSIVAISAHVHGAVTINATTTGSIAFDHARVEGQFKIEDVTMVGSPHAVPALSMKSATFAAELVLTSKGLSSTASAVRATTQFASERFARMRAMPLSCYPGWHVVEALLEDGEDYGVLSMLWDGRGRAVTLAGTSPPVHVFNQTERPHLNAGTVADYLSFFCHHVWGEVGPFRVIRSADVLRALNIDADKFSELLTVPSRKEGGNWHADALIIYGTALFSARLEVTPSGTVSMPHDTHLLDIAAADQPRLPRYSRPLRRAPVRTNPAAAALRTLLIAGRPWPDVIWFPGPWEEPSAPESADAIAAAARAAGPTWPAGIQIRRVRTQALSCFPGWRLVHGLADGPVGTSLVAWLYRPEHVAWPLAGEHAQVDRFVREYPPVLTTDESIGTYVRFVLAHKWEDGGPSLIVDSTYQLPFSVADPVPLMGALQPLRIVSRDARIELRSTVATGTRLFHETLVVQPGGSIDVSHRQPLQVPASASARVRFEQRMAFPEPAQSAPVTPAAPTMPWPVEPIADGPWTDLSESEVAAVKGAYDQHQRSLLVPVSLEGVTTRIVEDRQAKAWGDQVQLGLSGFVYDQIDRPSPEESWRSGHDFGAAVKTTARPWEARLVWLRKQFEGRPLRAGRDFDRQPHTQLARVYRSAGRTEDARGIVRDALNIEGRLDAIDFTRRWWRWLVAIDASFVALLLLMGVPLVWGLMVGAAVLLTSAFAPLALHYAFRLLFGFGLYTHRALLTFVGFLLIGWLGTLMANRSSIVLPAVHLGPMSAASTTVADFSSWPQVLFVNVAPVNTVLVEGSPARGLAPAATVVDPGVRVSTSLPCGDAIDPFLYAADVFIPLIDLKQESTCSPDGVSGWRWAKAVYAFLGWVVTSLTILTISGVLRQRSEE